MRCVISATVLVGLMGFTAAGCHDNTPPPPRVPVPAQDRQSVSIREQDEARPMPPSAPAPPPPPDLRQFSDRDEVKPLPPPPPAPDADRPPFDDVPIVSQRPPEQPAFVEAYRHVGSPRITLFVNRTLEGKIIPVNPDEALARVEVKRESRVHHAANYNESAAVYLRPGQYDEVQAKSLDYEAVENILLDWMACNGQVTLISPMMARQRLTDQQVKELQEGRPTALSEIAQQLGADILIQVQAHPTRQTAEGLEVRIIAEAMNTKGGQSIGRAVVDVPPPLEKTAINRYTRFLARKLMDDMMGTWSSPPPAPREGAPVPPRAPDAPPPVPGANLPSVNPSGVTAPPPSANPSGTVAPPAPPPPPEPSVVAPPSTAPTTQP